MSEIVVRLLMLATSKRNRNCCLSGCMGCLGVLALAFISLTSLIAGIILMSGGTYYYPMPGHTHVSSSFDPNRIHPIRKVPLPHNGTDFPAPTGTEVFPVSPGTVLTTFQNSEEGKTIVVDHGEGVLSKYKHLSEILVRVGEPVLLGVPIGLCGSTGDSTGPHLHLELQINGSYVDIEPLLEEWPEEGFLTVQETDGNTANTPQPYIRVKRKYIDKTKIFLSEQRALCFKGYLYGLLAVPETQPALRGEVMQAVRQYGLLYPA